MHCSLLSSYLFYITCILFSPQMQLVFRFWIGSALTGEKIWTLKERICSCRSEVFPLGENKPENTLCKHTYANSWY